MNFEIDPSCRTKDVLAMALAIREQSDYGALPILADALQEADCANEELLAHLRQTEFTEGEPDVILSFVLGDDRSDSIKWLEEFASKLDAIGYNDMPPESVAGAIPTMTYDELVDAATTYVETGEYKTENGGMNWQDALDGKEQEFWKHYQIATGRRVADTSAHFFSCSC